MLKPHPVSAKPPYESEHGWYYFQGSPKTFIEGSATVAPSVHINDSAKVLGYAVLQDDCVIYGNATIMDQAIIGEKAKVGGDAIVRDSVQLYGTTHVLGKADLSGNNVQLYDNVFDK